MALPVTFDHCVVHVSDWDRSNAFYRDVLGAELVQRPKGWAYRFGAAQLNLHGPGFHPAEVARLPVEPGKGDLCFEWDGPIADAIAHLERCGDPSMPDRWSASAPKGGHGVISAIPTARCSNSFRIGNEGENAHGHRAQSQYLPADIPVPQDDGAARHLAGVKLPPLPLAATDGSSVDLSKLSGRTVVYIYPRTGVPGQAPPDGWDQIPARAAAPRNRAPSVTTSPSSSGSASRGCMVSRRRTRPISARRPSDCICRSRSSPTSALSSRARSSCRLSRQQG